MTDFPRLRNARADAAWWQAEAQRANQHAADARAAAFDAGMRLAERQQRIVELREERNVLRRAVSELAARIGEIEAYRKVLDSADADATIVLAALPAFGEVDREYVHKLTGQRIRLTELSGSCWSYVVVDGGTQALWLIFEEDLRNEYTLAVDATPADATAVLPAVRPPMHRQCALAHDRGEPQRACVLCPPVGAS